MIDTSLREQISPVQAEMNRLLAARPRWEPDLFVPRDADWSRTNSDWILDGSAGGHDYNGAYPVLISAEEGVIEVTYAYAEAAMHQWCAEHHPPQLKFPLSSKGVEALRWSLPLIESYPFDAEEAIDCAAQGPCSRS
ncbi:hypothetical protein [Streptomyces sp. BH055]|uniref:hypothetical protein n=1 Tax=unclassified Streptomyces TaxID=2593676 RepID=UPI003BB6B29B